ncbi:hypothetical protein [Chitinophaga caeni]|uniref:hypothetical protein n=1 Tax=Chitinophaga caeni TaxID=2029983 RepID=UPI001E46FC3B|nr:hypothetical protein [Chitinophaga caeni]
MPGDNIFSHTAGDAADSGRGNVKFIGFPYLLFYVRYAHPLGIKRHYTEDIDNQSSADNYNYDKIGNIVSDIAGKITNIDWTVYGKIKRIAKQDGSSLEYAYDVAGNRIFKKYTEAGGTVHEPGTLGTQAVIPWRFTVIRRQTRPAFTGRSNTFTGARAWACSGRV